MMRPAIGKVIWVRNLTEILATLDANGKLDGLPFMPEMARYCGRSYRISHLALRTCVEGAPRRRGLSDTVLLDDLRCDGASHDGCQRGCRYFWKLAWLSEEPPAETKVADTSRVQLKTRDGERYVCQSTELNGATSELRHADILQHVDDLRAGELTMVQFTLHCAQAVGNRVKSLLGVKGNGDLKGTRRKTDSGDLNLAPGEWVEVKSREEVEATLNEEGRNRGLPFDRVMLEFCGRRYRVSGRVERIILEETGRMVSLRNTVILEDVVCRSFGCPRANLLYWRESWLKRVEY